MPWTHERAKIGAHKRNHPDVDVPGELYRDLRAARAEDYIRELIAAAPPLTDHQRRALRALLAPAARR